MITDVDENEYGKLLMQTQPAVIKNDEELERLTEEVNRLMSKGVKEDELSPEEVKLLELLAVLIEEYEDKHYPMPDIPPHEVLKYLMKENGYKQKDVVHIFGSSGITSEVVNGKRSISKAQAKKLAEFFGVSVELFI